jgi:hypothetical protein
MPHQSTSISGAATNNSIPNNSDKAAAVSIPGSGTGSGAATLGSASSSPTVALALQLVQLLQHQQQQQQHSLPWYMRTGFRHSASISTSSNCSLDGRRSRGSISAAGVTAAAAREQAHFHASRIGLSLGAQPVLAGTAVGAPDATVAALGSPVQGNSRLVNVGRVSFLNPSNFFAGGGSAASPRAAASSNNQITE